MSFVLYDTFKKVIPEIMCVYISSSSHTHTCRTVQMDRWKHFPGCDDEFKFHWNIICLSIDMMSYKEHGDMSASEYLAGILGGLVISGAFFFFAWVTMQGFCFLVKRRWCGMYGIHVFVCMCVYLHARVMERARGKWNKKGRRFRIWKGWPDILYFDCHNGYHSFKKMQCWIIADGCFQ